MHSLLKAVLSVAPSETWPYPPTFHGGVDANPQLGSFGCAGVAIFLADAINAEHAWLDLAKRIYSLHARAEGTEVKVHTKSKLRVLSKEELKAAQGQVIRNTRGLSPLSLRASNAALFAAIDAELQLGGSEVLASLKKVAEEVTREIPHDELTTFIKSFDRMLLREELRSLLAQRRDPRAAQIAECVWRFAGNERARDGRAAGMKITHYIGRLEDETTFLLLWKVGARWQIITGARDEILASVPDDQMESAVATLLG